MKHIYNTNPAAHTQRPAAKVLGTTISGKIFTILLLSFFLLVDRESLGQGYPYGPQTFDNLNGFEVQPVNNNIGIIAQNGQLRAYTIRAERAYSGYIAIKTQSFNLKKGYIYTISFTARALDHNNGGVGNITVLRGNAANINWSTVNETLATGIVAKSNVMDNYAISFTASDNFINQYLALGLSTTGGNQSELFIDNLAITEVCTPQAPQVINGGSCSMNVPVTLTASGAVTGIEEYRWYEVASEGTAISGANKFQYTTPNLSSTKDYYVSIYNLETRCESPRVKVTASVGGLIKPTVKMTSGSCEGGGNELKTFTASGGSEGSYRWYKVNNDNSLTPVNVNGELFTGSILTRNTNSEKGAYYVRIVGLGCESDLTDFSVSQGYPDAPTSASGSICGNQLTLTAIGAGLGESYNWYGTVGGTTSFIGQGATVVTGVIAGATYSVSRVNTASGCESTTKLNISTITNSFKDSSLNPAAGNIIQPTNPVVGREAIYEYSTSNIEPADIVSHTWYIHYADGTKSSPIFTGSVKELKIESMPTNLTGIELFLTLGPNACYTTANNGMIYISNLSIIPLPIELISFKAQRHTKGVNLIWATASELDNKGFEVQVSTDSKTFQSIGFVESKVGTTSIRQDYSLLDTKAVSGTRYYRLKQIDFDGTSSFSAVRAVSLGNGGGAVAAYPNPFDDVVIVTLNGTEARQVRTILTNPMGKVLMEQNEETAGNSITVNMAGVTTKGMYMLHVLDGDAKHTFKLIKR